MSDDIQRKNPAAVAPPAASYSQLTIVPPHAHLFVLSGQVGLDSHGELPEDINLQIRNALENCKKILESEGLDSRHVIKVNFWLTEKMDRALYNEYWSEFHQGILPSATLAYVSRLTQPRFKVEVEVWAAR